MKENKKIRINYNDKEYILEYNRKSVSDLESMGFIASEFANKPATMLPLAFKGAFIKNHRFVKQDIIDDIFNHISDRQGLISQLSEMIMETYQSLLSGDIAEDDKGNVSWEIVK